MTRAEVLEAARACVCEGRDSQYGAPEDCFGRIAKLWSAYLEVEVSPHDVAILMMLLKVARLMENPTAMDSWIDAVGYGACGGELAGKIINENY